MTKLDVLDHLPMIKICVGYEVEGKHLTSLPSLARDIEKIKPIYEEHPGWNTSTENISSYEGLPDEARSYLERIEELCGASISMISVGPMRSQTFFRSHSVFAQRGKGCLV